MSIHERNARAAYGMTFPELIRALGGRKEEESDETHTAEPGDC